MGCGLPRAFDRGLTAKRFLDNTLKAIGGDMLVWTDLETTGLNPDKDLILEIAMVVTDDHLNELAVGSWVTDQAQCRRLSDLHPVVQEMHLNNGLWNLSREHGEDMGRVRKAMRTFLSNAGVEPATAQLAGSTISFDRSFLRRHFPEIENHLHYRNLDVSSVNEIARRFWPDVWEKRPGKDKASNHRAMDDIRQSIETLKYYVNRFDTWRLTGF